MLFFSLLIGILISQASALSQGIKIDHTCTDSKKIPDVWIQKVKTTINLHFAHTSHGMQIIEGLKRLADPSTSLCFVGVGNSIAEGTSLLPWGGLCSHNLHKLRNKRKGVMLVIGQDSWLESGMRKGWM
jgi:hypothetical protein